MGRQVSQTQGLSLKHFLVGRIFRKAAAACPVHRVCTLFSEHLRNCHSVWKSGDTRRDWLYTLVGYPKLVGSWEDSLFLFNTLGLGGPQLLTPARCHRASSFKLVGPNLDWTDSDLAQDPSKGAFGDT